MSNKTQEINKITTTIIGISIKLIVYALIVLMLYEAVARGYAFGHEIFYAEAVEDAPGHDIAVRMKEGESVSEAAKLLARNGLIKSEFAFIFQSRFYDYDTIYPGAYTFNTSMTSKEILQKLNEKPEGWEEAKPAGAKAGAAAKAAPGASSGQPAAAGGAETGSGTERGREAGPAEAAGYSIDREAAWRDGMENQETYEDEEQEMEGGWFEDVTEGQEP